MKKRRTIIEAAIEVLKHSEETLSVSEIYAKIIENSLYEFHAQDPLSVLRVELRGILLVLIILPHLQRSTFYMMKEVALSGLLTHKQNMIIRKKKRLHYLYLENFIISTHMNLKQKLFVN